jgi:methylmalonyl-CoA/ethylmalonyl-CoA epimerase
VSQRYALLMKTIAFAVLVASGTVAGAADEAPSSSAPAAGPLHDHSFAQIAIQVTDLDRAVRFYRDTLGLRYLFIANGMVFFQVGEARLMVERGKPGRSVTLYFDDPDLERSRVRLETQGIRFAGPIETVQRTESYDLKLVEFSDPDGNPLALMGNVKRKD